MYNMFEVLYILSELFLRFFPVALTGHTSNARGKERLRLLETNDKNQIGATDDETENTAEEVYVFKLFLHD